MEQLFSFSITLCTGPFLQTTILLDSASGVGYIHEALGLASPFLSVYHLVLACGHPSTYQQQVNWCSGQGWNSCHREQLLIDLTRITQVWVLTVWIMVLSSLITKFVLKNIWLLVQWLAPVFPMDLCLFMCIWGASKSTAAFPSTTPNSQQI